MKVQLTDNFDFGSFSIFAAALFFLLILKKVLTSGINVCIIKIYIYPIRYK